MFGFDWTGDGSVDFVDDLITLSMLGALDEEAPDEDNEDDEDDWRLNHENWEHVNVKNILISKG